MKKPSTIFFDVNETLLDLAPLKASVGAALGGREDLLPLWFTTMLHYSLVDTLNDDYRNFDQVGVAALMMIGEKQGIHITREEAEDAIVPAFLILPPHADVKPSLEILSKTDLHLVSVTNTDTAGITAQFKFADIIQYFDQRISTEEVGAFKPDPRVYQYALQKVNADAEDVLMIAAHAWDLAGAKKAGLQTAFIRRPGAPLYPNVARPDYVVDSLAELTEQLTS